MSMATPSYLRDRRARLEAMTPLPWRDRYRGATHLRPDWKLIPFARVVFGHAQPEDTLGLIEMREDEEATLDVLDRLAAYPASRDEADLEALEKAIAWLIDVEVVEDVEEE